MAAERGVDLEARAVRVSFGGVHALQDVEFRAPAGTVHALIGPNGSGKTTLLNALSGFVRARGEMRLGGRRFDKTAPHQRAMLGLGRTFQNPRADASLTVRDVLRLGEHLRREQPWWLVTVAPRRADRALAASTERAYHYMDRVGIARAVLDRQLSTLPAGVVKMVDIVRALLAQPRVLLLDEPSSGMNEAELGALHEVLEDLRRESLTVVLVEHHLRFAREISDSMSALAEGRVITAGTPEAVLASEAVEEAYLGVVEERASVVQVESTSPVPKEE